MKRLETENDDESMTKRSKKKEEKRTSKNGEELFRKVKGSEALSDKTHE